MRTILFGIPDFGFMCLDTLLGAKKEVTAVALPPEGHPAAPSVRMACEARNIPYITVGKRMKDPELIEEFKKYNPDLIIIAAYAKLIPPEIYTIPKLGTINCHPSLLPDYRGSNPYFHCIYNNEKETGITFHYLDNSFDTGDIIYQCKVPIAQNETLGTLFTKLSYQSSQIYVELINRIEAGETLVGTPQPKEGSFKSAPEVKFGDPILKIDWSKSPSEIERLVRASNPFFGAYAFYRNTLLKIWNGFYIERKQSKPTLREGMISKVSNENIEIAVPNGYFYPTCVEYGSYFIMDIKDFIKRTKPKIGEMLY